MLAVPAATAVTSPVAETVATLGESDDQVMVRPVRTLPLASLTSAIACVVPPVVNDDDPRFTVTAAAVPEPEEDALTAMLASPLTESTLAMIVPLPIVKAVTIPVDETTATAVFVDDHVTVFPVRVFPAASTTVAVA
jgi:hypothetical protein